MPTTEDCINCLKQIGKHLDATAKADLQEGLCPKRTDDEVYVCEKTGEELDSGGKIRLL